MTDAHIRASLATFVLAAAAFVTAPAVAAPIVSFAQGQPAAAFPCALVGPGSANPLGECAVPTAVTEARATWLDGVANATFEEFENDASRVLGSPALFSGAATMSLGQAAVGSGFYQDPIFGGNFLGRFNTTNGGGSKGWWFEYASGTATIRFADPIEAFGFYLTDLGDEDGGSASLSLFNGQDAIAGGSNLAVAGRDAGGALLPLLNTNGSVLFFGVTSDGNPFDSVTLTINPGALGSANFAGLDSLIIGQVNSNGTPVPTPGTLALTGLALLCLRCFRIRR